MLTGAVGGGYNIFLIHNLWPKPVKISWAEEIKVPPPLFLP